MRPMTMAQFADTAQREGGAVLAAVTIKADDPTAHVVHLSLCPRLAEMRVRFQLRVTVVLRHGATSHRLPECSVPGEVASGVLPDAVTVTVEVHPTAVVDVVSGRHMDIVSHVTRVSCIFQTLHSVDRAAAHLVSGNLAEFVAQVSAAARHTDKQRHPLWRAVRNAALMRTKPRAWRLFKFRYVLTRLYDDVEMPAEDEDLRRGAAKLDVPPGRLCDEDFVLPVEHANMLASTNHSPLYVTNQAGVLKEMEYTLLRILIARQPLALFATIMEDEGPPTMGNGVTVDLLHRYALKVVQRHFVAIDGVWWFLQPLSSTSDTKMHMQLRALAVAICSLILQTGMGPGIRFAEPVLHAFAGTNPVDRGGDSYLPATVRAVLDAVEGATAEELQDMSLPLRISGPGWELKHLPVSMSDLVVTTDNRMMLRRAAEQTFWDDVVTHPVLRHTVAATFSSLLGQFAIAGLWPGEFGDLLEGPGLNLPRWKQCTGVLGADSNEGDVTKNVLFEAIALWNSTERARALCRFWTGADVTPTTEDGHDFGCWVNVLSLDDRLPVAHTCTKTLDISRSLLLRGATALSTALLKSVELVQTSDPDIVLFTGD
jgi:hypothetical protein